MLVAWIIISAVLCVLGLGYLRRLTQLRPGWRDAYICVWAGFGLVMFVLLLWHFFLPINAWTLCFFLLVALVCAVVERRWLLATLTIPINPRFALIAGAVCLWVANHALGLPAMDDYNYELHAVRWFHDFRIVPGLANLNGRIGFNNSHHLWAALLSVGPWSGAPNPLWNGFFLALAIIPLLASVQKIASGKATDADMFAGLLISPCLGLVVFGIFGPMISTLKADVFICAATVTLAILLVEFAGSTVESGRYAAIGATLLALSAVMFSVKLSGGIFSAVIAVAVGLRLITKFGWKRRQFAAPATIAVLVVFCTLLRGAILSGYPLYPSTVLGINVDWRVPVAQARAELAYITSWAQLRATYDPSVVTGWAWIRDWARNTVLTDKFNMVLPLALAAMCGSVLATRFRRLRSEWHFTTLGLATMLALSVWFVGAPAVRFGLAYFWILLALLLTAASTHPGRAHLATRIAGAAFAVTLIAYLLFHTIGIPREFRAGMVLMLALAVMWTWTWYWSVRTRNWLLSAALCVVLGVAQIGDRILAHAMRHRAAEIAALFWLPVAALQEDSREISKDKSESAWHRTRQGIDVYQTERIRYSSPLLSTRYFNPFLELRRPGDLSAGFRSEYRYDPTRMGYSIKMIGQRDVGGPE